MRSFEWKLTVVDEYGQEHERSGTANNTSEGKRSIAQAVDDIAEDVRDSEGE